MVREVHLAACIVEWGQILEAKELVGADHLNIKVIICKQEGHHKQSCPGRHHFYISNAISLVTHAYSHTFIAVILNFIYNLVKLWLYTK